VAISAKAMAMVTFFIVGVGAWGVAFFLSVSKITRENLNSLLY
jgi:hypothetical protein